MKVAPHGGRGTGSLTARQRLHASLIQPGPRSTNDPPRLRLPELGPPAAPGSFLASTAQPAPGTDFQASKGSFLGYLVVNRPRNHWKSLPASRAQGAALISTPAAHPQSLQQRAHGTVSSPRAVPDHGKAGPAPAVHSFSHSQKILPPSRLTPPGTRQTFADSDSGFPRHN